MIKKKLTFHIFVGSLLKNLASEMKAKLVELVLCKLKSFAVPHNFINMFNESFVSVDTSGEKILKGGIVCVVCYAESKQPKEIKPNNVFCRNKSSRLSWVISNFVKHLQRAHSFNKIDEEKNQSSNEQHLHIDADENSCSNQNTSVDNMSCEIMNMVFDSNVTEMDSMENQLNEQISKQIVKMWNIATVHGEHLDCGVQCTNTDDLHISVDVVQVHGNGDCLLSSAAHQLFGKDINSPEHKILTDTLRANVVKHIQEHYDDFFFDIRGHVLELQEIAAIDPSCDTYGFNDFANIDDACKHFIDKCLILPGFWAGAETLKAIHFIHGVDIVVFYENGHVTYYNNKNEKVNRIIALAYRVSSDPTKYNHYDSVCSMQPEAIYNTAKIISKRLNQNNSSTIVLNDTK